MHVLISLSLALFAAAPAEAPGSFPFPGSGPAWTDYLVYDAASHRVWVPAGSRGATYAFDVTKNAYDSVPGFATEPMGKRVAGPSSVTSAPGAVYVGNRAGSKVCAVDRAAFKMGACVTLPSMPDGLQYVPSTQEIWVTTPKDKNLTIVSTQGGQLKVSGTVAIEGSPEGFAIDPERGVFYTNDEDGDRTYAIDVKTRKVTATLHPNCGKEGPRGLVFEAKKRWLFVACSAGASVLDLNKDGALLGHLDTAAGNDTIDYVPATHKLLLASGRAGKLVVAQVGDHGELKSSAEIPTSDGVRAVVVDEKGNAYLPDSKGARLLVIASSKL